MIRRPRLLLFLSLLILALPACAANKPAEEADPQVNLAVLEGNNQTALDLYAQLRSDKGNLFFSPSSISMALGMTCVGARGETADEIVKVLHFPLEFDQLAPAFGTPSRQINGKRRGYELRTANALWGQKGTDFKEAFLETTRANFGAGLKEVDFRHAPEEARKTINEWVEKQTKDRIKDLFPQGTITSEMQLALTNAIYFKGNWDKQFSRRATSDETFRLSGKESVEAPLMNQTDRFGFLDAGTFLALEMLYEGQDLSMVVLLPKEVDGLADLEQTLTANRLSDWIGRLRPQKVMVTLPKLKVTCEFTLNDALGKMGMKRAFTNQADFSGINGRTDLRISLVAHKAFVEVNEEGTKAAAAAATGMVVKSLPPVFRADHPFLFLIRDLHSGSILFLGRLANPKD
ncbi:MAG: serpin family protein [Planctomycetes bacterium]|nr:serpin family protein [Planctomycetota bacterium]